MPTPVTNKHMAMLSGSARKAASTCNDPTGNHSNNVDDVGPLLGGHAEEVEERHHGDDERPGEQR